MPWFASPRPADLELHERTDHDGTESTPERPRPPNDRPLMVALALGIVWASSLATQYVAWRWHFDPRLGRPLVIWPSHAILWPRVVAGASAIGAIVAACRPETRRLAGPSALVSLTAWILTLGPLYAPYYVFSWYRQTQHVSTAAPLFRVAWIVLALAVAASTLATLGARRPSVRSRSTAHGSAGWGDGREFGSRQGFALGRDATGRILRYEGDGHLLTIAPTRSGKGVSCVVPNLLGYPGSALVTDMKSGELYAVTARHRATLSRFLYALDPFGTVPKLAPDHGASFNPLDLIDPRSDDALDDARLLAEMLVVPDMRPTESTFWIEEARGLLTGLILHVACGGPHIKERTLIEVRRLLTLPPDDFAELLDKMLARPMEVHGLVARAAARIQQKADKERSGVISTAQSQTHFLDSPRMRAALSSSTFQFTDLKRVGMTVYVILPSDRVVSYAGYVRLMIGCGLLGLYRVRGRPMHRVLFLLDEFGDLGHLGAVERAIRLAASAGAAFWLLLQDLSRLRATYGESAGSFLAGTAVKQVFGTNDLATAEYVSGLLGQATVPISSHNQSAGVSRGRNSQHQQGTALTASVTGRKLLLPDEVMRLDSRRTLICIAGARPLKLTRVSYLEDREYVGLYDPNPVYAALPGSADCGGRVPAARVNPSSGFALANLLRKRV